MENSTQIKTFFFFRDYFDVFMELMKQSPKPPTQAEQYIEALGKYFFSNQTTCLDNCCKDLQIRFSSSLKQLKRYKTKLYNNGRKNFKFFVFTQSEGRTFFRYYPKDTPTPAGDFIKGIICFMFADKPFYSTFNYVNDYLNDYTYPHLKTSIIKYQTATKNGRKGGRPPKQAGFEEIHTPEDLPTMDYEEPPTIRTNSETEETATSATLEMLPETCNPYPQDGEKAKREAIFSIIKEKYPALTRVEFQDLLINAPLPPDLLKQEDKPKIQQWYCTNRHYLNS